MAVKIKDIAKLAGVSEATVSLALNNNPLVNSDTRQRILALAEEMGYTPNSYARKLVLRRSGMLGLVIPDIENVFYASLVRQINRYAQQAGYGLSIAISDNTPSLEAKIMDEMVYNRMEGVIYVPVNVSGGNKGCLTRLSDADIPVVCSTTRLNSADGIRVPSVMSELRDGMKILTRYLLDRGYKRLAYITGPDGVYALDIRREGFLDAVREHGLKDSDTVLLPLGEVTYSAACEAAKQLLPKINNLDAVICVNDMMALGVVNTLGQHGISVPNDIAVAGFDDVIFAVASPSPLTTVRQDIEGVARESVSLLQRLIKGHPVEQAEDILLPAGLVVRQSTK
ncbi:MAG: LacI family DNA-binding transcriptional regulator [Eubacteriales bacterium]